MMHYGDRVRVLVVDDEPSICKALTTALSRAGYDAFAAQSGEAALSIVRSQHIDVMLIDLRIPDTRGDVVFEIAAATQPHLKVQTLFMTGDISEKGQKLILACHCDYLQKPFDLRDMIGALETLCPRAQSVSA
jgi:DNA-binding response OmpR family regulator